MDLRFALLLACFLVSGFAALLYQTVWSRELSFVFGTSELAVAAVLAAYMGGLALGAAAAGRYAQRLRRPVLAYGLLELAIAVCALLVPWGIRGVNALYVGILGGADALPDAQSAAATLLQLAGAFAVLLPPTAFMGATLPLLARHAVHKEEEIASRVGVLYAVNTAGAIAGTLCAAFWLMPEVGLRGTEWVGASLNGLVFTLAALLARSAPLSPPSERAATRAVATGSLWILPAIAVSGMVSFSYEVLWTRLLGHLLGGSIHGFASMLASFLLGIALGSAVAARLASSRQRAVLGFALVQLGIALTSYGSFALSDRLPELAAHWGAGPSAPLASFAVAVVALLPITLCIGATFPFAVRVLARDPEQTAAATARVYSWNTVGAIVGALGAGFVLLPELGFHGLAMLGIAVSLSLALLAALAMPPRRLVPAAAALAGFLALVLAPLGPPWSLLTSSPMAVNAKQAEIAYSAVGRTTTVMLLDWGARYQILTDGLPEAKIASRGMFADINVAQWLGALPALVRPEARDELVVGLGGGVALELVPRTIESIDVIEIEPEVLEANRRISDLRAIDPLSDPRVHVHIGDARGTLQLTGKRYDAIVSQPSHPWTAGASHLYTREFFSLARSRLKPDGVFVQWIGLVFVDEALLRSLLAALLEAFPHVELFQPQVNGLLFVASAAPIDALAGAAQALAAAPQDYDRLGLHSVEDFASAWVLDEEGVRALAGGAPPNTDDRNLLAARSARLGDDRLDPKAARALMRDHDPLLGVTSLDRPALIRSLLRRNQPERATDLALATEGNEQEVALGWVELGQRRSNRAARHFQRALALAPDDDSAIAGVVASGLLDVMLQKKIFGIDDRQIDPRYAAVIEGWRLLQEGNSKQLATLETVLARIGPEDPLFEAAARLRVEGLIATGVPEQAAAAEAITQTLLARAWSPADALLRARAAIAAGRVEDARGSLLGVIEQLVVNRHGRVLGDRILELARELPEDDYRSLEVRVAKALGRRPKGTGADLIAPPAPPETP